MEKSQPSLPPESAIPPMTENKKTVFPLAVMGVMVGTILLGIAVFFFWRKQSENIAPLLPTPPVIEGNACTLEAKICPDGSAVGRTGPNCEFAPCPSGLNPLQTVRDGDTEWQTYSSTRNSYQFSYPARWDFLPYPEDDPQVQTGTHVLSSYDTSAIEQYTNRGVVDWEGFLGETSAVKLDVNVSSVSAIQRTQFEAQLTEEGLNGTPTRQNQSNLQIANLPTTQLEYAAPPDGRSRISTYFAYPNEVQAIVISLFVNNADENFEQSPEWADVKQVFQSFVFGK